MFQYLIEGNVENCQFIISFVDIESHIFNIFIDNNYCI